MPILNLGANQCNGFLLSLIINTIYLQTRMFVLCYKYKFSLYYISNRKIVFYYLITTYSVKISAFLIDFIGLSVALWLALDFITSTLTAFKIISQTYHQLPITKSMMINSFIHYVIVFLITIPVFKGRMKFVLGGNYE